MRIVKRVLSTYSADNFGFCSALYELGGLVVMHDASGCNSTYNTHDEPRWYDTDSMVFISGLTEKDAIFGNDDRLIDDLVKAAEEMHPRFVAVCGGPLPHIIGTDFQAVAKAVWRRTGIPSFGLQTNGMDSYVRGAGGALAEIAELVKPPERKRISLPGRIRINLLGVTPLDFSVNGSVREMEKYLERQGFSVLSTWAMGNTLDRILSSADADVNLVVSACGLPAAKVLHRRFGIPFAVGVPAGRKNSREICAKLREAAKSGRPVGEDRMAEEPELSGSEKQGGDGTGARLLIIGEPVLSDALAREISLSLRSLWRGRSSSFLSRSCGKPAHVRTGSLRIRSIDGSFRGRRENSFPCRIRPIREDTMKMRYRCSSGRS